MLLCEHVGNALALSSSQACCDATTTVPDLMVSQAATAAANVRGDVRWAKPAPKTGPSQDVVNIAPAPL